MSNIKHPKCALRTLAAQAKDRLSKGTYQKPAAPTNITPGQREIYLRLLELKANGEEVVNPIAQLADPAKLRSLSHEDRQRYILQLSADYVSMRTLLDSTGT